MFIEERRTHGGYQKIGALVNEIRELIPELQGLLANGDLFEAEIRLRRVLTAFGDALMALLISRALCSRHVRKRLGCAAGREGLRFHHVQRVKVRLANGTSVSVDSPWYRKVQGGGRRKPGPKSKKSSRKGKHLGLEYLGFEEKISPVLADEGLRLAATMPSLQVAAKHLAQESRPLSQKALQQLVANRSDLSYAERATLSLAADESVAGRNLVLCVDGGRVRERDPKRGPIPKKNKRRGFHAPWREAVLFTLYAVDEEGNVDRKFPSLVDGVVDGESRHADFLQLLEAHLSAIGIADCSALTLVCDGAPWHWTEIPQVLERCGVESSRRTEVLDYVHAKQNLHELVDLCDCHAAAPKEMLLNEARDLLYAGQINELASLLVERAGRGNKRKVRNKLNGYFLGNSQRMQYAEFRERKLTVGSGGVESAIRRVVNLRIKAPGNFWIPANAEAMIYLRAQLLYGRWQHYRDASRLARRQRFDIDSPKLKPHAAA